MTLSTVALPSHDPCICGIWPRNWSSGCLRNSGLRASYNYKTISHSKHYWRGPAARTYSASPKHREGLEVANFGTLGRSPSLWGAVGTTHLSGCGAPRFLSLHPALLPMRLGREFQGLGITNTCFRVWVAALPTSNSPFCELSSPPKTHVRGFPMQAEANSTGPTGASGG